MPFDQGLTPIWSGFLGSLIAGLGTGVGAIPIFFRRKWGHAGQAILLSVAAGIMLGATVFSLIVPALDVAQAMGSSELGAAIEVGTSIVAGALAVWGLHAVIPHTHFVKGADSRPTLQLGRHWLFILAITIHNFPEGLSVGVAYGDKASTGFAVALGIGLQNLPEGLAVAAALISDGFRRSRAFLIALMTGLVEPVGGLVGAIAVSLSDTILPFALGSAAGAMLFVISGEVIPETHREGREHYATMSLVAGFVLMMFLDIVTS